MRIEWIKIKGFRNFNNEKINFSDQTLIIGANDVGKTNLVFALRLLFDRSLSDQDLDLSTSDYNVYTGSETIEITVKLIEITEESLISIFKNDLKDETVYIQYNNSKEGEYDIFSSFSEETLESRDSRFYLNRLNMEYVNTNRNLEYFMKREKNQILEASKQDLTDEELKKDEDSKKEIDENLNTINGKIDELNYIKKSLNQVNDELCLLATHNENQKLSFKNANSDPKTMLENLELIYSAKEGILTLGGDGRNNQIFLATWVSKQKNMDPLERVTFYAIEEPEAHLHPHQQRKLSSYLLDNFDNQVFLTTHSPYIATEFKPDKIVKLYIENNFTKVAQGGCSKKLELEFNDFGYRLNAITSDIFFVNAVFLVEGPSEQLLYTALAEQLDIDLDRLNASIISINGIGFKPYIKICLALNIPFVLRTDNDIFNNSRDGYEYSYNAGISRIMGIYTEVLKDENNKELREYWDEHRSENEWKRNTPQSEESKKLEVDIIRKVRKDNIFLAEKDLEKDLVNSNLYDSLKAFYKTREKGTTVKKMQTFKAENMLAFLKNNYEELKHLKDHEISAPIKSIEELAKKAVNENE